MIKMKDDFEEWRKIWYYQPLDKYEEDLEERNHINENSKFEINSL